MPFNPDGVLLVMGRVVEGRGEVVISGIVSCASILLF